MFVHADTQLPAGYDDILRHALRQQPEALCAFRLHIEGALHTRTLALISRMANWRSRRLGTPYGDQAFACTRAAYRQVGGFDGNLPLMEDLELVQRWRRSGRPVMLLSAAVRASPRRWYARGPWRVTFTNWFFAIAFMLGRVSPRTLYRWYYGTDPPP